MSTPAPEQRPPTRYSVDTVELSPRSESLAAFFANGKRIGHGVSAWLWAPWYAMPSKPPWRPVDDPPVIVLLDTEIRDHTWLGEPEGEPFLLDPAEYGWRSAPPPDGNEEPDGKQEMEFGKYWGHATFLAGIIRRTAPGARLLVLPVMDQHGKVNEADFIEALRWLPSFVRQQRGEVVVVTPFGGELDPGEPADAASLRAVKEHLTALADLKVPVVVSAGNQGSETPRYPAAFATDPKLAQYVVSVGARVSETGRAPFSNFGVWVREWREATDVVSLMPLTPRHPPDLDTNNYAWWSGTSFAAASYAGERARQLMELAHPAPATAAAP